MAAVLLLAIASCASLDEEQVFVPVEPAVPNARPAAVIVPPTVPPRVEPRTKSWVTLPEMPPDATQADYGRELYRLVCSTCHGDHGQGLTAERQAATEPAYLYCWQSKCHDATYPEIDDFELPRRMPPVVGTHFTARYRTAADLYVVLRATQPYQARGMMLDEEYWQLTAYLLELNGFETDGIVLDEKIAPLFNLRGS